MERANVIALIIAAVEEQTGTPSPPVEESTPLFGDQGWLDSMGLVGVVLDVEAEVAARTGLPVALMDDRAMSQGRSPFRSVEAFGDYVMSLLAELRAAPAG